MNVWCCLQVKRSDGGVNMMIRTSAIGITLTVFKLIASYFNRSCYMCSMALKVK